MAQDAETFPERIIDLIWACCLPEKHEDIVRATYELITELAITLPPDRLEHLYSKIQSDADLAGCAKTGRSTSGWSTQILDFENADTTCTVDYAAKRQQAAEQKRKEQQKHGGRRQSGSTKVKIIVSAMQIIGALAAGLEIVWPQNLVSNCRSLRPPLT